MSSRVGNIIIIDDTDPAIASDTTVNIIGINVYPTGATHDIKLTNGAGQLFFEHDENSPAVPLAKPLKVTGIIPTTVTTARVYIYIEA